jgi:hypothetical protein
MRETHKLVKTNKEQGGGKSGRVRSQDGYLARRDEDLQRIYEGLS